MGSRHGISLEVIERNAANFATSWLGTCTCRERWTAPTYEATEDKWRQHVHAITGKAPHPFGNQIDRWTP